MYKVTLISSESAESKEAIKLLKANKIPFTESLECSYTAPPMLLDPQGRHPYIGINEIKTFLRTVGALIVNGK